MAHSLKSIALRGVKGALRRVPPVKRSLLRVATWQHQRRHAAWLADPSKVRAIPRKMTVAITAGCDQRCVGCKYGRDFMPGHALPLEIVNQLLEDGAAAGVQTVRLYGGEPLLHKDLPAMVRRSLELGMSTYVTTNGGLLGRRIDELYDAGLRGLSIGYYGKEDAYDSYVQRKGRYQMLRDSLQVVRDRYGSEIKIQLNYLIMRPSCTIEALEDALELCEEFDLKLHTDLIHYSLPYFMEGNEHKLAFRPEDRPALEAVVDRMIEWRRADPLRVTEAEESLRSIPDWIYLGPELRIPCDAYKLLWIGADGTVQLCYVTFPLGNLHEKRLSEILFTKTHHDAARGAFCLDCPGCHCERDQRIRKHAPSQEYYSSVLSLIDDLSD